MGLSGGRLPPRAPFDEADSSAAREGLNKTPGSSSWFLPSFLRCFQCIISFLSHLLLSTIFADNVLTIGYLQCYFLKRQCFRRKDCQMFAKFRFWSSKAASPARGASAGTSPSAPARLCKARKVGERRLNLPKFNSIY